MSIRLLTESDLMGERGLTASMSVNCSATMMGSNDRKFRPGSSSSKPLSSCVAKGQPICSTEITTEAYQHLSPHATSSVVHTHTHQNMNTSEAQSVQSGFSHRQGPAHTGAGGGSGPAGCELAAPGRSRGSAGEGRRAAGVNIRTPEGSKSPQSTGPATPPGWKRRCCRREADYKMHWDRVGNTSNVFPPVMLRGPTTHSCLRVLIEEPYFLRSVQSSCESLLPSAEDLFCSLAYLGHETHRFLSKNTRELKGLGCAVLLWADGGAQVCAWCSSLYLLNRRSSTCLVEAKER